MSVIMSLYYHTYCLFWVCKRYAYFTFTGKCLDCLDGSDGEHCEKCVSNYVIKNGKCESAPPGNRHPILDDEIVSHSASK